jgi:hypothetical protein
MNPLMFKAKACSRQLERRLEILTASKWRTIYNEVPQQGWVYMAVSGDWRRRQEMIARRFLALCIEIRRNVLRPLPTRL